jgi:hypothetical protein
MALTNDILQSAILVPVCIGFNLRDRVTPSVGLALAVAVWSLQVPASVWWLKHFRFGPAEWVWRSLTYGRLEPMVVEEVAGLPPSRASPPIPLHSSSHCECSRCVAAYSSLSATTGSTRVARRAGR